MASGPWVSPEEYINYIAGNIFGELYAHLRGKTCAPFMNDMKAHVHSAEDDWFYYPDVMVNCDPAGQHKYFCNTPSIILEVLSPDSEMRDRREKRLRKDCRAAHLRPRFTGTT